MFSYTEPSIKRRVRRAPAAVLILLLPVQSMAVAAVPSDPDNMHEQENDPSDRRLIDRNRRRVPVVVWKNECDR